VPGRIIAGQTRDSDFASALGRRRWRELGACRRRRARRSVILEGAPVDMIGCQRRASQAYLPSSI